MDGMTNAPNKRIAIVANAIILRFARLNLARYDIEYLSLVHNWSISSKKLLVILLHWKEEQQHRYSVRDFALLVVRETPDVQLDESIYNKNTK